MRPVPVPSPSRPRTVRAVPVVGVLLAAALMAGPADASPVGVSGGSPSPTAEGLSDLLPIAPAVEIETVDPVGAAAALLFWFEALNHANATGEVQPFIRVSEYTCGQCALAVDEIEKRQEAGLEQEGGLVSVDSLVFRGSPQEGLWIFDAVTTRDQGTRTAPDGSVEQLGFESGLVEAQVVWQEPDAQGVRRLVLRSVLPVDQAGFDQ